MSTLKNNAYDSRIADKANTPFARKLQELIPDAKTAHCLKDHLGVSIQAINQYKWGTAYPKTENLIKIADYFGISVDYLLGLSAEPNRDTSIQAVHDVTGLSAGAIVKLHDMYEKNAETSFSEILSLLLEDSNAEYFLYMIKLLIEYELNGNGNTLVDVNVAGNSWKLYSENLVKASLQTNMIENITAIAKRYSAIKCKEAEQNGKH